MGYKRRDDLIGGDLMLVLQIIGILAAIVFVYLFVIWTNEYIEQKYNYTFFNMRNYLMSAVGYVLIYFGNEWYLSALQKHQDLLNGQLLIAFGVILLCIVIYFNIKNTSLFTGGLLSVVQLLIYSVLAYIGFLTLVLMVAYFSQTKPVYNVND